MMIYNLNKLTFEEANIVGTRWLERSNRLWVCFWETGNPKALMLGVIMVKQLMLFKGEFEKTFIVRSNLFHYISGGHINKKQGEFEKTFIVRSNLFHYISGGHINKKQC